MIVECDFFEKERPVWQPSKCHGAPVATLRLKLLTGPLRGRSYDSPAAFNLVVGSCGKNRSSPRIKGGNFGLQANPEMKGKHSSIFRSGLRPLVVFRQCASGLEDRACAQFMAVRCGTCFSIHCHSLLVYERSPVTALAC